MKQHVATTMRKKTQKIGCLEMESNALIKLTFQSHIGFQHMDKTILEKV